MNKAEENPFEPEVVGADLPPEPPVKTIIVDADGCVFQRVSTDGFLASFDGECAECDTPIREGDRIERGDEGYRHVVCPPERPSRFQGTTDEPRVGPARPADPTEALAVLRELVELWNTPIDRELTGPYRKRYETAQARARALVAGAAAPAGGDEPNRCGDNACWPSRPERACIRHVDHQGEHENRDGKTWISPGRALRERDELRRTVAGAAAPAGDAERVETREEWGVAYGEEVDPGWRYVDRKTADVWMDYARDSPHMNARLFRRTVTTSPWVAVPDPADPTNTED